MTGTQLTIDFAHAPEPHAALPQGVALLQGQVVADGPALQTDLVAICASAPWRSLETPGGLPMSVQVTNCGAWGWVSDRQGYRYVARDPTTDLSWPAMPELFQRLAQTAADVAGFTGFTPDSCLINRYAPGARMTLHQDLQERDRESPVVSVSLGLPAVFCLGGMRRTDAVRRIVLRHGDVLVWGGPARLLFHGILPIQPGHHPLTGGCRINLTFRRTGLPPP